MLKNKDLFHASGLLTLNQSQQYSFTGRYLQFFGAVLFVLVLTTKVCANTIPDWVRDARVAGLSLQRGAEISEIQEAVVKLRNEGVSVVELDTSLSLYWTDDEFTNEVAFIQTVAQEIHANGMKVVVYYPALEVVTPDGETAQHSMGKDHPEWLQIGLSGNANVFYGSQEDWVPPGGESAWMSPNSPYKEYFQGRCNQLVTETEVDGLWVDVPLYLDTGAPWADVNPQAKSAFTAWSAARGQNGGMGYAAPSEADFNDPVFRTWLRWRHENLAAFIDDVRASVQALEPNFVVGIETYPMDYLDTVWTGLDAAYMERSDNFFRIWEVDSVSNAQAMHNASIEDFSNKLAMYKWARGLDRDMPSWSFSYAYQGLDAGLTIAATVATKNSPFESQTPVMTKTADSATRQRWYEFIGENADALLQVNREADVGIWFSSATREYQDMPAGGIYGMYLEETPPTPDPDWWAQFTGASLRAAPHLGGWRGAAHGLHQLGVPYRVVHSPGALPDLVDGLSMIWLPNVGCMSDAEVELLRDYVAGGGTVLATGVYPPAMKDELGNPRPMSGLDEVFGFGGRTSPTARMQEFGAGVAIYRPDIKGRDLFAGQGGTTGAAARTLGEVEQVVRIHSGDRIIADLPKGVFVDISEVIENQQHLYVVNYSGLQQPLTVNLLDLPLQYRAPKGYRVTSATRKSPDLQGGNDGELLFTEVAQGVYEVLFTVDQFALLTFNLEPISPVAPVNNEVTINNPLRLEAVNAGLQFILEKMRHSEALAPVKYGIHTNLKDNDGSTDVYTGGWHVTAEHMGLFLRVTALLGDQQSFDEAYQFVRDVLFSKGYQVVGWSMHKDKHTRFLQADELNEVPVQMAANAPLDDLRVIHGLLDGEYLVPEAAELGRQALNGLYWTTVTDRKRGATPVYPQYPGGILGVSWDWEDQDDPTLDPPAVATGLGRLGTDLIPIDYQDLETMALAARYDSRWMKTIASAVDLLLASEIPGSPGLFYNSYGADGSFSGDFEYQYPAGQPQGANLKTIQELWTILHLKRISKTEPWILDGERRQNAAAAAQRGYDRFKNFYLTHSERIPEYLTFQGEDVPSNILVPEEENLLDGEVRIYAQLARLAILFDDDTFAGQIIDNKLLTDRVTDASDPRYGMFGLMTAGTDDAEAWNTLEALLTILLASKETVVGDNQSPVANADSLVAGMDTVRRIRAVELLGNDTDPDGDVLSVASVSSTSAQGGSIALSQGDYLYTPPAGYLGSDSFVYTITDGIATAQALVTLDVRENDGEQTVIVVDGDLSDWAPDHPAFMDPVDISGAGNTLDIREMHLDNDVSKFYFGYHVEQSVAFDNGFTVYLDTDRNPSTGFAMWDIGADYMTQGSSVYSYVGNGTDWSWQLVGDGQAAVNGTLIEFSFDRTLIGNPASFDFIFYGYSEANDGSVGAVDYIPDNVDGSLPDQPTYLTYEVGQSGDDGTNQPPVANADAFVAYEDTVRRIPAADLLGNDTDPDGDVLSVASVSSTSAQGGSIALSQGDYLYTPPAGYLGSDSFVYTITDGIATAQALVTLDVRENDGEQTVIVVDGDLSDWAPDHPAFMDPVDISGAGNTLDIREMHLDNDVSKFYFGYHVEQSVAFDNGFTVYLDTDRNPSTGFAMWDIGADYMTQGSSVYSYVGNGTDWSWQLVGDGQAAVNGTLIEFSFDRTLIGNPTSFDFIFYGYSEANDGSVGAVDYIPDNVDGSLPDQPTYLTYEVRQSGDDGTNQPPVANADAFVAYVDTVRRIPAADLLGNDTDPDGDVLSVASVSSASAQGGSIALSQGDYLYTPPAGYLGSDSFVYTITDGIATAQALVTLDVRENDGEQTVIVVDGDLSDWAPDHPAFMDPVDISGAGNTLDIREMHLDNDVSKFYFGYHVEQSVAFDDGFTVYLDTDRNLSTGFAMWDIGADYMTQGSSVYSYVGNGTDWSWQLVGDGQAAVNGTLIEFSFDRTLIGNPASFDFILYGYSEANDGSVGAVDYIPDNVDGSLPDQPTYLTYEVSQTGGDNMAPTATDATYSTTATTPVTIPLEGIDPDAGDVLSFTMTSQPSMGTLSGTAHNLLYPEPVSCGRETSACFSPNVAVTEIDVGVPVMGYGQEGDTDPLPMAIAALPSGGSRLAWLGTDNRVYLAKLDCNDQLVGTPTSIPAVDLQDLHADDEGGVVLVTRNATNGGTDNCGSGQLCGGSSSQCKTMHMVRFDDAGNLQWEQQVTNLSDSLAGYDNGARFVWWYQHHGRLAFDGSDNYAAYFSDAITVNNGSCVDIHQGDRMQVVDSNGSLVAGHSDSFEVGCSHSWQTRMVWDPRTNHFVMVCATDNACRIAQPNPYRTVAGGNCDGTLFGGDLVLSSTPGYWTVWSQGGQARLEHFTTDESDTTISTDANTSHPHLVSYGSERMLLSWESGSSMAAQIYDSGSGQAVGDQFTIDVPDHNYQAFKAYPDGSVAYPAAGSSNTSIRIARVMPCSD